MNIPEGDIAGLVEAFLRVIQAILALAKLLEAVLAC